MPRSHKKPDQIAGVTGKKRKPQSLHAKRLRQLIEQVVAEHDGNKRDAAKALGIDPSTPSKFDADPLRDIRPSTPEEVIAHFEPQPGYQLSPDYFTDPRPGELDYHAFVVPRTVPRTNVLAMRNENPSPANVVAQREPAHTSSVVDNDARYTDEARMMLSAMAATDAERAMFESLLRMFNAPFVDRVLVQVFLASIRANETLLAAADRAINETIRAQQKVRDSKDEEASED